jgi:hypothetical protein
VHIKDVPQLICGSILMIGLIWFCIEALKHRAEINEGMKWDPKPMNKTTKNIIMGNVLFDNQEPLDTIKHMVDSDIDEGNFPF